MSKRRVIRGQFIVFVAVVLIAVISVFKIPSFIVSKDLAALGYDSEAQKAIVSNKLSKLLIDNQYYSDYLNAEVKKDGFNAKYAELYIFRDELSDFEFNLYDKLLLKGYSAEDALNLFKQLPNYEITPLLVFDKTNVDGYISDCLSHSENSADSLTFSNDYLKPYENVITIEKVAADALVSSKFSLGNYEPAKLVPLSSTYASEGVKLENEAYQPFLDMVEAMSQEGLHVYALGGYRSYSDQEIVYSQNEGGIKAGHSDMQTGYAVSVADTATNSTASFNKTKEYAWMMENAYKYGFILRFPEGKEAITGYKFTPYIFRYVGKDLAGKIHKSGLTFDEYYMLYLYDY